VSINTPEVWHDLVVFVLNEKIVGGAVVRWREEEGAVARLERAATMAGLTWSEKGDLEAVWQMLDESEMKEFGGRERSFAAEEASRVAAQHEMPVRKAK
jgi:hypothetical protein